MLGKAAGHLGRGGSRGGVASRDSKCDSHLWGEAFNESLEVGKPSRRQFRRRDVAADLTEQVFLLR